MEAVTLKAKKNGFEIVIRDTEPLDQAFADFKALLERLHSEQKPGEAEDLDFTIFTGQRLLTAEQKNDFSRCLDNYARFHFLGFEAQVVSLEMANIWKKKGNIQIETGVIHSGQALELKGDVLFLGALHAGGTLKAAGNIFVLGSAAGVLHAGFPDHSDAVIVGDLGQAAQARIADTIDIIDHTKQKFSSQSLAYINDLHILNYSDLSNFKALRPKIVSKMEEQSVWEQH